MTYNWEKIIQTALGLHLFWQLLHRYIHRIGQQNHITCGGDENCLRYLEINNLTKIYGDG